MAGPRPEKKRGPQPPADIKILPMELQVGDRLADDTSDWGIPALQHSGGKDGTRARPENRRARELGDTKLGRFQPHQREADERRGGQAMMRLGRRASLLVAFSRLISAATAYAECAWVPWERREVISPPF
jgi:hypothetical protein